MTSAVMDEVQLTQLIGAMARNNAAMERDLRGIWDLLAGHQSLAVALAPTGTKKLIEQCRRMLLVEHKSVKWARLSDVRREVALQVLKTASDADAERDRMVHRTWYPTDSGTWNRSAFVKSGLTQDSIMAAEVKASVDQAKDAAIRVNFLSGAIFYLTFDLTSAHDAEHDAEMFWSAARGDYESINGYLAFGKSEPPSGATTAAPSPTA